MTFLEVLVEGSSDVPVAREILARRFALQEGTHFRIHPHRGKGKLRSRSKMKKAPVSDGLLDQLPIKLRNLGAASSGGFPVTIVVLVDADDDNCTALKQSILNAVRSIGPMAAGVLVRIAIEETESWFLAQPAAIQAAYPRVKTRGLKRIPPDSVCGAWERLAEALGFDPSDCGGQEKVEWAEAIAPHLDLREPRSPSLRAFLRGIEGVVEGPGS